jgi:hypothetical protein
MDKANNSSGIIDKAVAKIQLKLNGNLGIFLYKILNDILWLLIISYILLLISEGIIPGLISAYMSFTRLTFIIFAVLGATAYLGKTNDIRFEFGSKKTVLFYGLVIFSVILIINSLLKFAWWEIAAITISSIFLLFYLDKNLLES